MEGAMKRIWLASVIVIGAAVGAAYPVTAFGGTTVNLSCSDGTVSRLVVDADTLVGLTQAIDAMAQYPAGLTCTLATIPLVLSFGAVALASSDDPFVVGGGRYQLPCAAPGLPGSGGGGGGAAATAAAKTEDFYWVNIAVNAHQKDGDVVGTLNETIPSGQCVPHGHFTSKPTCVTIVDNSAYVTSVVTQTSGDTGVTTRNFFASGPVTEADNLRFSFIDNGNPGQQPPGENDRLNGIIATDNTCADGISSPPPLVDLLNGNISVHP
jgi:hypothetical protein